MANATTELKVIVKAVGKGEIDKLSEALKNLGSKAAEPVNQKLKNSVAELKKLSSQSAQTKNNVKGFSSAFKELANNLEIGSAEFKQATAEAAKLDKQLAGLEKRKGPSRLAGAAKTAGAISAGGIFGGPEGFIGASIGAIAGAGATGAAVGAAIGAQVGQLREALAATAEYSANLDKLRIALQGVTTSEEEYGAALDFIQKTTEDFAIPQEVVTRQFTQLQASVQGAGGDIKDTETAFNGIVAAVRATGGSLNDVDAALTATAQVFSKGKVSAEELRQQIGERLPGAFTLFAESMGITPQELDKALEDGKVSLQDFQGFAKAIFDRYGENAKTIAQSTKSAGDQLKVGLDELKESVGTLLQPIGAAFQKTFLDIVNAINAGIKALNDFLGIGTQGALNKAQRELDSALKGYERFQDLTAEEVENLDNRTRQRYLDSRRQVQIALKALEEAQKDATPADIARPEASSGLPGITPASVTGTQAAKEAATLEKERLDILRQIFDIELKIEEQNEKGRQTLSDSITAAENELALLQEQDPIKRIQLDYEQQRVQAHEEAVRAIEATDDPMQQQLANQKLFLDLQILSVEEQNALKKATEETNELFESLKTNIETGLVNAMQGLIDGTKTLNESLVDVLNSMASLFLQAGIGSFNGADGTGGSGLLGLFADGGVIAKNKVVPFASGGVVTKPTLFPMANGAGLMGEAGAEAIMPLRRTSDGRLGVEASGSNGGSNIVVNVDASGSSVQGNSESSKALGSAIGAAVQAELIKQKRPGGLLS